MANKQTKSQEISNEVVDRVRELPPAVLHYLLSFLPSKDVVRTSALSRKWRNIWCSVPTYHLDEKDFRDPWNFFCFIDSLISLRDGSDILKLCLLVKCRDRDDDVRRINTCILHAVRHHVQALDINIDIDIADAALKLTTQIFTCPSLRELKFSSTYLRLPPIICLPVLSILHLFKVDFQGELDKDLFSAIPLLQTFIVEDCSFDDQLVLIICAHELKTLILNDDFPESLDIIASKLNSIELKPMYSGYPKTIRFKSIPTHLMHADLNLQASCFESIVELFRMLENVHSLTLSGLFIPSFTAQLKEIAIGKCIQAQFCNLKWLKLGTRFSDGEILVVNTMLQQSPLLESLFLENETGKEDEPDIPILEGLKAGDLWFTYDLPHLKIVSIQGFQGSDNEVKFIKVVLGNARVLEELVVLASKSGNENEENITRIGLQLLHYPRASPSVGFLFR